LNLDLILPKEWRNFFNHSIIHRHLNIFSLLHLSKWDVWVANGFIVVIHIPDYQGRRQKLFLGEGGFKFFVWKNLDQKIFEFFISKTQIKEFFGEEIICPPLRSPGAPVDYSWDHEHSRSSSEYRRYHQKLKKKLGRVWGLKRIFHPQTPMATTLPLSYNKNFCFSRKILYFG